MTSSLPRTIARSTAFSSAHQSPMYPVADANGSLWFGGKNSKSILRVSGSLAGSPELTVLPVPAGLPDTPVIGPDGDVWFCNADASSSTLFRVSGDLAGSPHVTEHTSGYLNPMFMTLGEGCLWAGPATIDSQDLLRVSFAADGSPIFTSIFVGINRPLTSLADGKGNIWVGTDDEKGFNTHVIRLSGELAGAPAIATFDTGIPRPQFQMLDRTGNLWFGSKGTSAIVRVSGDLSGTPTITRFDTPVDSPCMGGVAPDGSLWFGSRSDTATQVVSVAGDLCGTPTIVGHETHINGWQFPRPDAKGGMWFGGTTRTNLALHVSGDLSTAPVLRLVDTGIGNPCVGLSAPDPQGTSHGMWFGNLSPTYPNFFLVRVDI